MNVEIEEAIDRVLRNYRQMQKRKGLKKNALMKEYSESVIDVLVEGEKHETTDGVAERST